MLLEPFGQRSIGAVNREVLAPQRRAQDDPCPGHVAVGHMQHAEERPFRPVRTKQASPSSGGLFVHRPSCSGSGGRATLHRCQA